MGKYNDELRDASLKVGRDDVGATEEQALSEFIHQIQQQHRKLQDIAEEKRAELTALREGEEAEEDADELP
jgi:hypothetical protein